MIPEGPSFGLCYGILLGFMFLSGGLLRGEAVGKVIFSDFSAAVQTGTQLTAIKGPVRSIVVTPDAVVVGSNVLAAFDGERWERIEAPATYAFRALAAGQLAGKSRIYVGASGEVGYVDRTPSGYRYQSLNERLRRAGIEPPQDVWNVVALPEGAVWIATNQAIRARFAPDGATRLDSWVLPAKSHLAGFDREGAVWIYQDGIGLLHLGTAGSPKVEVPEATLPQRPVEWVTRTRQGWWMGLGDSAYRLARTPGFALAPAPRLSAELRDTLPTCATGLDADRIAIGTFDSGIVLAATDDSPSSRISTANGLNDNRVYALAAVGKSVWVGLGTGLVRLDGVGTSALFERHESLGDGIPLKLGQRASGPYALTSKGLFNLTPHGPEQDRTGAGVPAVLDATEAAGQSWIAGVGGLWRQTRGAPVQELFASNDVGLVAASVHWPHAVLFVEGYRLKLLTESEHGGWASHDLHAILPDTPVSLLEDPDQRVWVSTIKEGIYCYAWIPGPEGASPQIAPTAHYLPGAGLPAEASHPVLHRNGESLYAFCEQGILRLRGDRTAFVSAGDFQDFVGVAASAGDANEAYWVVRHRSLPVAAVIRVAAPADGHQAWQAVDVPGLDRVGSISAIQAEPDGTIWVGGDRGLLRYAPLGEPAQPRTVPSAVGAALAAAGTQVGFSLRSSDALQGEVMFFQTRLLDTDTAWSAPSLDPERTYLDLPAAHYMFEARGMDRWGRTGPVTRATFIIPTPVWRAWPVLLAGSIALILTAIGLARWRILRLQRKAEALERLVRDRTREIELASTAKSEFLENISHEIRNPLNGLTGLLSMMQDERMGPSERELVHSLRAVAANLTRVFEDILGFSKLEYGYAKLDARPFGLRRLLEEIRALVSALAHQLGSVLTVELGDLPSAELWVVGDEGKIRTILVNLVANALKYAPGTPVQIAVELISERDGMVELIFDVTDQGPGIPLEEQELIFKKFVRGSAAQDGHVAGAGLGLATCHALARLLNGSVGVESAVGAGATFYLRVLLPRSEPQFAEAVLPEIGAVDRGAPTVAPTRPARAGRALIVDDEDYNRRVLEGVALTLGYRPVPSANADEALAKFAASDFAVVFLDWELPGRKGGEIARAMRALEEKSDAPRSIILATTAHDSDEMRVNCLTAGMDGFLLKPFDVRQVGDAIRQARLGGFAEDEPARANGAGLDERAFEYYIRAQTGGSDDAKRLYWRAVEASLERLTAAFANDDRTALAGEAHRLRGLSGLIRAQGLNRAAGDLVAAASAGATRVQLDAIHSASADLRRELGL